MEAAQRCEMFCWPKAEGQEGKKTAIRVERDQYVVPSPLLGKGLPLYLYLIHFILPLFELM